MLPTISLAAVTNAAWVQGAKDRPVSLGGSQAKAMTWPICSGSKMGGATGRGHPPSA
jgi:hypothetical protein